ncbi:nuclear transport factor 2 family protein [Gordonia sp. LSe1-13]|uniref:Nuclear transport factor 2 family protein n=1 Tax=Gordonia sesuvii TaxID=3116777 RepID=A0ABU7MD43_9ACTN|nr:nuclear transport factor 2 family protein [Gordonia sp. LSe1-13]
MAESAEWSPALDELIQRNDAAAKAYINGEIDRFLDLVNPADDYTLFTPFGGEAVSDMDRSEDAKRATAEFFQGGEAALEVAAAHMSGDLAVLIAIERQHGRVGGRDLPDCSLRVTLVFRHDDAGWRLLHRHADPLVHPIDFDALVGLLGGAEQSDD